MSEVTLVPVDPTPDDVQYLEDRISEFNSSATGIADGELLAFFVRERGRIVAGISGNTWGGTCEVRQFWVDESPRHRGLGTKLFRAAEQEARFNRALSRTARRGRGIDDRSGHPGHSAGTRNVAFLSRHRARPTQLARGQ